MNWFERLKDLYEKGLIDKSRLNNSISKGLITEEEKAIIINSQ